MSTKTPWSVLFGRFARLGFTGFGGPPAHVVMMRRLFVESHAIGAEEFNDAFAAVSMLPGPASTQLALWLGHRLRGWRGLAIAAALFITPSVVMVIALSSLIANGSHRWLFASAIGAAAVVPVIALKASYDIARHYDFSHRARRYELIGLMTLGAVTCVLAPALVVVAMLAGGAGVVIARRRGRLGVFAGSLATAKGALALTAIKVGALSFGGGFVIVPMMRSDAVTQHHWMTASAFSAAVAIGQLTPGPVVATIGAVGYAVGGWTGGCVAAVIAFAPSVLFIGLGGSHIVALRQRPGARAFLDGAGPVATGAIAGSAIPLSVGLTQPWQWCILALGAISIAIMKRSVTVVLVLAAALGLIIGLATTWAI